MNIHAPVRSGGHARAMPPVLAVLVIVLLPLGAARADGPFRRGDANADGTVDMSDGLRLLLSLFDRVGAPSCADAADADDSGALDVADAAFTFAFLFTGGPVPPAPGHLRCGADPTPDGLGCEEFPPCSVTESLAVGPGGGRLEYPGGIVLDVPPGAVTAETTITLGGLPDGIDEVFDRATLTPKTLLGGFSAEPDGLVFEVPIRASVPVDPLPPGSIPVAMGADLEAGISWLERTDIAYDPDTSRVDMAVHHFSNQYVGSIDGVKIVTEVSEIPADHECREGPIHVTSEFVDFESVSKSEQCAAVSDNVQVRFLACDGKPTEHVVASSIKGEGCDISVRVQPQIANLLLGVERCSRIDLEAIVTINSPLEPAAELNATVPAFWSSRNPEVATVDVRTGVVTAVGPGVVVIDATTADPRFSDTAIVTVGDLMLEDAYELAVDEQLELPAAACGGLLWESSDPQVARYDPESGLVTGMARGQVTMTLAAENGGPVASATVEVFPRVFGVWSFTDELDFEDDEVTATCRVSGELCVLQRGSEVGGGFRFSGLCEVTPRDGSEPFELALEDSGPLFGTVGRSSFSYVTVSEFTDEECENSGTISEDRPLSLSGPVVCREELEGEILVTTGTGSATRTAPECLEVE